MLQLHHSALKYGLFTAIMAAAMLAGATARADVLQMPSGQTSLQFVPVGNPGNAADPLTGLGAVGYAYQMGKYDVTLYQYTAFLNAVATTSDPCGLYYYKMATDFPGVVGIAQSGSAGSYSYSVIGNGNDPAFDVSWGDAARFCNWLQNGQPTGPEGAGTTETGAYTLNGGTANAAFTGMTRNAACRLLPSVAERMVQGGILQREQRDVLALSDPKQHAAHATPCWPAARTTRIGARPA